MSFKKYILSLDKKSDEFFEAYHFLNDLYWETDDPNLKDEFHARKILKQMAEQGDFHFVQIALKLITELISMIDNGVKAVHGAFGINSKEYHFDLYTEKSSLTNLEKMLRNNVVVKSQADIGEPK